MPLPHLLIVDDDPLLRRAMARVLAKEFDVSAVATVGAALRTLEGRVVEAILCDLHLDPDATGLDLYRRLLADSPALAARLVIVTGAARQDGEVGELRELGVPVLEKPLDHDATFAVLRRVALGAP